MTDSYGRLHDALNELLAEKEHQIEAPPTSSTPLFLVLSAMPDIVAFALCNKAGRAGFAQALESFKALYVVNSVKWANYDLTLVLCRTESNQDQDAFWREIELDPYFCRKFVIDIREDIQADLGHLPFIPLRPEKVVGFERPPSAHTLLVNRGVSPWLAEALAVPHKLGEARIVEHCLNMIDGVPPLPRGGVIDQQPPYTHRESNVWLKSLEIANFRAYRKPQKFDLDANLIVIYGSNGLGKTSCFDAIDFVCTGGITRLDERFGRRVDRLVGSMKHLDSLPEESLVKASLLINGKAVELSRRVHDRTSAVMDGEVRNRTDVLAALAACFGDASEMRVENLVRLFRATHLFGQQHQSLTSGLRDESRLPEDTVSRMLAFQDYVEAINKSKKVSDELEQMRTDESELGVVEDLLRSKQVQLDQLSIVTKAVRTPHSVEVAGKRLVSLIMKEVDLGLDSSTDINQESARSWRALLEGKLAEQAAFLSTAQAIEAELPELPKLEESLKLNQNSLSAAQKAASEIETNRVRASGEFGAATSEHKEALIRETALTSKLGNMHWLLANGRRSRELRVEINKTEDEIARKRQALTEIENDVSRLKTEGDIAIKSIQKLEADQTDLENTSSAIEEFEKGLQDYLRENKRRHGIPASLEHLERELREALLTASEKRNKLERLTQEHKILEKAVEETERGLSDFQRLVENIKEYDFGSACPLCGTPHESKSQLFARIDARAGKPLPGSEELRKKERLARARIDHAKHEISDLGLRTHTLAQEIAEVRADVKGFTFRMSSLRQKAKGLGIQPDSGTSLSEKKAAVARRAELIRTDLLRKQTEEERRSERLRARNVDYQRVEEDLRALLKDREVLVKQISTLAKEALSRGLSINEEPDVIRKSLGTLEMQHAEQRHRRKHQEKAIQKIETEYSQAGERQDKTRRLLRTLSLEASALSGKIEDFDNELSKIGLNREIVTARLQSIIEESERRLRSLESLRDKVLNFELALDEAQRSAAFAKLHHEIEDLTKDCFRIRKHQESLADWKSYFDKLGTELDAVRKRSLREYVEKYGPLASSIQRRLRSVYGFGELTLQHDKGGIALQVQRKGHKQIFPSDYFSESQIQTVTLSLFLSAVLTQTWSSFSPILLDDPVTHFDDLNAYSFLDVIRGLIDKPGEGHQFILSTCEERLYRLMRQKFAKLPSRTVYYEFGSIGEDGPVIKQY